ncbi:MAG TPA: hypothetical protein VGP06_14640 [Janthinobacterium sp.]|jgi:hypothetical protein|nr:hypothetical protein [Janthinobacterium sp.]
MNAIQFPRLDTRTADIVEAGIRLHAKHGAANAWAYMATSGVPISVIKRVLSSPGLRRRSSYHRCRIGNVDSPREY